MEFATRAGLSMDGINLHQEIHKWRSYEENPKIRKIFKAVPIMLIWELWKMRNARKHRKDTTLVIMKHQVQKNVFYIIKVTFPRIKYVPFYWDVMPTTLLENNPRLYYLIVKWYLPKNRWIKCNTDDSSKGNQGMSSYGFCIIRSYGNLIYTEAHNLGFSINMEAESITILKSLNLCHSQNLVHVYLETDSLGIKKMIMGYRKVPWALGKRMEKIKGLMI